MQPTVVMDATRLTDGMAVCIKRVKPREDMEEQHKKDEQELAGVINMPSDEVEIARFLSGPLLPSGPNHSVTILDSFQDPLDPVGQYLVMPLLRPFDDPAFGTIDEVIDFVGQVLEVSSSSCLYYEHS
jgi:hypothetical protein